MVDLPSPWKSLQERRRIHGPGSQEALELLVRIVFGGGGKMIIELDEQAAQKILEYLLNAKKRAEFVIAKKGRYDEAAVTRAENVVQTLNPLINALLEKARAKEEKKESDLEKRVKQLEAWKEQTNIILKKLVAYHSGEV
jgi:hypothetical protein